MSPVHPPPHHSQMFVDIPQSPWPGPFLALSTLPFITPHPHHHNNTIFPVSKAKHLLCISNYVRIKRF